MHTLKKLFSTKGGELEWTKLASVVNVMIIVPLSSTTWGWRSSFKVQLGMLQVPSFTKFYFFEVRVGDKRVAGVLIK